MKTKRPRQHFDLVEVLWDDASGIRHGWAAKSEKVEAYVALSVGFLISRLPHPEPRRINV